MGYKEILNKCKSIESLSDNAEAPAIVTHLMKNSSISYPFCTEKMKKDILRHFNIKKRRKNSRLKFVDLFAGIGGFYQAFTSKNCECVFSSEWDEYAKKTYYQNYGVIPFGDIRKINEQDIPDHDILCAGFPCQPFSIAGVSKKKSLGRSTGFDDEIQGTLFFDVARIIKCKRPKAVFLENVKNLLSHDKGQTWRIIKETLEELDYKVFFQVVDGKFWVPQHRERIFIVCFDRRVFGDNMEFKIPTEPGKKYKYKTLNQIISDTYDPKLVLTPKTWESLKRHKEKHQKLGNGFGYKLLPYPITSTTITATISARYYKDGAEILVPTGVNTIPRKLSIEEAMQLQGYMPTSFFFPVPKNVAYKQIGNSVVVPAITSTAKEICSAIRRINL